MDCGMGEGAAWHQVGLREVGMHQTTQGSDYRLYPQIFDFMLRAMGAQVGVVKSKREQTGIMEWSSRAPTVGSLTEAQKDTSSWCILLPLTKPLDRSRSVITGTKVSHNHTA